MTKVLITGGAGYIEPCRKSPWEENYDIIVYDNLSTGHKDSILYGELVKVIY